MASRIPHLDCYIFAYTLPWVALSPVGAETVQLSHEMLTSGAISSLASGAALNPVPEPSAATFTGLGLPELASICRPPESRDGARRSTKRSPKLFA